MTFSWTGESLLEQAASGVDAEVAAQRLLDDGLDLEDLRKVADFLEAMQADPSVRDRVLLLVERTRVLAERGAAGAQRSDTHRAEASRLRAGGADGAASTTLHHELSNSLTVAIAALGLVSASGDGPDPMKLVEMARRHLRLIARLLDTWSRAERLKASPAELSWGEVDLGALVRECVDDVGLVWGDTHELTVSIERTVVVPADADALRQVVINLLMNAAKFSPRGSRIDVSVAELGSQVEVAVRDRGPGVSRRDAQRIFEAGQRVDPAAPGLGLGLFVARQLANAHGGELQVTDAVPGARFVLRIPSSGVEWQRSLKRREDSVTRNEARQQRRDEVADDRDAELDERETVAAARDEALDARGDLAGDRDDALDDGVKLDEA